jgi:hypothetical protein
MSSEGFKGVPGVPDGWELVGIRRALNGEFIVNAIGNDEMWNHTLPSEYLYPIIRKIDQPDRYRAFANAMEAEPFWDEELKLAMPCGQSANTRFRICVMTDKGIRIGIDFYSYAIAFHRFVCADGTPFGVKIDER